jgi:hypothetical protein
VTFEPLVTLAIRVKTGDYYVLSTVRRFILLHRRGSLVHQGPEYCDSPRAGQICAKLLDLWEIQPYLLATKLRIFAPSCLVEG